MHSFASVTTNDEEDALLTPHAMENEESMEGK